MFTTLTSPSHRPTASGTPSQQQRYNPSILHPVFFTDKLGKPGVAFGGMRGTIVDSSMRTSPVAEGYVWNPAGGKSAVGPKL